MARLRTPPIAAALAGGTLRVSCAALAMTLDTSPVGVSTTITGIAGHSPALVKARAIGLREGRTAQVIARNGRLVLVQIGHVRLAITQDLARRVEVRQP